MRAFGLFCMYNMQTSNIKFLSGHTNIPLQWYNRLEDTPTPTICKICKEVTSVMECVFCPRGCIVCKECHSTHYFTLDYYKYINGITIPAYRPNMITLPAYYTAYDPNMVTVPGYDPNDPNIMTGGRDNLNILNSYFPNMTLQPGRLVKINKDYEDCTDACFVGCCFLSLLAGSILVFI